jgi:hypothetical protein
MNSCSCSNCRNCDQVQRVETQSRHSVRIDNGPLVFLFSPACRGRVLVQCCVLHVAWCSWHVWPLSRWRQRRVATGVACGAVGVSRCRRRRARRPSGFPGCVACIRTSDTRGAAQCAAPPVAGPCALQCVTRGRFCLRSCGCVCAAAAGVRAAARLCRDQYDYICHVA